MRSVFLLILTFFGIVQLRAQPYQIKGYVRDGFSGDLLPNAHIQLLPDGAGVVCNSYGFFSFSSRSNRLRMRASFTGYEPLYVDCEIKSDTTFECNLFSNNQISEVKIQAQSTVYVGNHELGSFSLTGKELEQIPTLLGERDVVKALQMMPGIKMGKEGSSGLYVRGGTPGQNLMLLDGVPVYNVNHLFGLFSVFTPEAVKRVDVYKGAFPANYGGRISSVIDVKMREGNLYETQTDLTVGTLSSKLVFETPIVQGRSSVLVAARFSNLDLYLNPFMRNQSINDKTLESTSYRFYDLNVKLFYDLGNFGKLRKTLLEWIHWKG